MTDGHAHGRGRTHIRRGRRDQDAQVPRLKRGAGAVQHPGSQLGVEAIADASTRPGLAECKCSRRGRAPYGHAGRRPGAACSRPCSSCERLAFQRAGCVTRKLPWIAADRYGMDQLPVGYERQRHWRARRRLACSGMTVGGRSSCECSEVGSRSGPSRVAVSAPPRAARRSSHSTTLHVTASSMCDLLPRPLFGPSVPLSTASARTRSAASSSQRRTPAGSTAALAVAWPSSSCVSGSVPAAYDDGRLRRSRAGSYGLSDQPRWAGLT